MQRRNTGAVITSPFLSPASRQSIVLVLLNYTLPKSTANFWTQARSKICADGAANRLYDMAPHWLPGLAPQAARETYLPDVIAGDMDSIRPEVQEFYETGGVEIIDLSADQDTNDMQKCLSCAEKMLAASAANAPILAIGGLGGRFDHALCNINVLYKYQHLDLVLCGEGSLVRLLPRGEVIIRPEPGVEGPMCGVIALGKAAVAHSSGLKWNLDGHTLEVGGLMSSSNCIEGDEVVIDSSEPVLWITEFRDES